jgi:hypothetical protein
MLNSRLLAAGLILTLVPLANAQSRSSTNGSTLTADDRAEIELLSARYALALGTCNAKVWPELFATPDAFFASGSRGKVLGQQRLAEMIRSYNCVYTDGVAPPHAPAVIVPYKVSIEPSPDGAVGILLYNGGRYEDVYTRTKAGWRFRSRTVVTNKEQAAGLSASDFDAIQRLAAAKGGPYEDVYEPTPQGRRFKSAGVVIEPAPGGAAGKAYLKDGTYYEDLYTKTASGWQFKSRTLVANPDKGTQAIDAR